jgi:hypothetical protein
VAGTFIRLGQKNRAHELADFFFQHQRPAAWHQWAEVVMQKVDTAHFIGDMPHTWVGSDFIRSALDMFAYERETDSSLVIAAGIPANWVREDDGIRIENLSTQYGPLSYSMKAKGKSLDVLIGSGLRIPSGGLVVVPPIDGKPVSVVLNGTAIPVGREIRLRSLPATLTITY